jgi:hypothetical protein
LRPGLVSLSEEIVRWGFEVALQSAQDWKIAFTNPTAGPWKKISGTSKEGKVGEVHRFEIDESRPDLVIYSDSNKAVIIIEAKTSISGLVDRDQITKTSQMYSRLTEKLQSCAHNSYWNDRASYAYYLGLLWGTEKFNENAEILNLVNKYEEASSSNGNDILCIEGTFMAGILEHKLAWGSQNSTVSINRIFP